MITFRASGLGHACDRRVYLESVRGIEEPRDPGSRIVMDCGTALESVGIEYMRLAGWDIGYNPGNLEAKECLEYRGDGFVISGHYDAIGSFGGGELYVLDIKTMNSFAYREWKKLGTKEKYPQYLTQVGLYGYMLRFRGDQIAKIGIVGLNRDRPEYPLPVDSYDYDEGIPKAAIERAERIAHAADLPEIDASIPDWCCRYCGFRGVWCDGI
jgi:hypothetical protein